MSAKPPAIPMPTSSSGTTQIDARPGDDNAPRAFPCEGCGAVLTFNIGEQNLACSHCGFVKSIALDADAVVAEQDFHGQLRRQVELRGQDRHDEEGCREVRCDACGATVRFAGTLTSSECAYCGLPLQLDHAHDATRRVPVDGVLPFLVEREKARGNLRQWVCSRWFAPNDFKARGVQGRFNGVYLPYWSFDTLTATHYIGERGEHYWVTVGTGKNKRRVRRTHWYPASGTFQRFFDDVLTFAATGLPVHRITALEPWPLNRCAPFKQEVLAGFLARTYDIPLDDGFIDARSRIDQAIRAEVRQRIGGDTQRIHSVHSRYDAITYKHLLLPVWMLAYRYRENTYQVVVNASTGEVQGDRPYSWVKILFAVLSALALAGAAAYLYTQGQY